MLRALQLNPQSQYFTLQPLWAFHNPDYPEQMNPPSDLTNCLFSSPFCRFPAPLEPVMSLIGVHAECNQSFPWNTQNQLLEGRGLCSSLAYLPQGFVFCIQQEVSYCLHFNQYKPCEGGDFQHPLISLKGSCVQRWEEDSEATNLLLVPREARVLFARHSTFMSIIHTTYSETASVVVRNHNDIVMAAIIYYLFVKQCARVLCCLNSLLTTTQQEEFFFHH